MLRQPKPAFFMPSYKRLYDCFGLRPGQNKTLFGKKRVYGTAVYCECFVLLSNGFCCNRRR